MIYVVTPCQNAINTIEQTILSIVTQAGNFDITYHIQDGDSHDGTIELLERWKSFIDSGQFPIQCQSINFTYSSSADSGMYDAIVTGFDHMAIGSTSFMTWINADDILMPGALALIDKIGTGFGSEHASWIGGATNIVRDGISITQFPRPAPTDIIACGLCDGQHWGFVQQEGVFFRRWLWDKVDAPNMLRTFKYAGDWNLWRLFAAYAKYIQCSYPLGGFRITEGQLSQINKEAYINEMDACISSNKRKSILRALGESTSVNQRLLKINYSDGKLSIIEKSALGSVRHHYVENFQTTPSCNLPPTPLLNKEHVLFNATTKQKEHSHKKTHHATNNPTAQNTQNAHKITPDNFNSFTYAKKTHWDFFKSIDVSLFGRQMDQHVEQLKVYQDLLVLKFIQDNIPVGSSILDVGGGQSRILEHLANTYECWEIDKLDGVGNGPKDIGKQPYHLVRDYMGNFNQELPDKYFDFVFSISALEHVPQHDPSLFDNIIMDIQRVLKTGGYSLHLFDIVLKKDHFWSNKITNHFFQNITTINKNIDFRTMNADNDLYVMSEAAYNKTWLHSINKTYEEHGAPSSLNILWCK